MSDLLFRVRGDTSLLPGDFNKAGSVISREAKQISSTVSKELKAVDDAAKFASGNIGGLSGAFTALLNPTALLAGGALALSTALFSVAKQSLDLGGELFDLSKKVGFSVESLSALRNSGQTAGVELNSISAALGIFDKNLAKAKTGTDENSKSIRALNLDLTNNETALRQAFQALIKMPEGAEQTALAMQLFGRSGKDVLGVLKEMDGDLDKAIAQYREMGTLMDTETARAADQLGDSLTQAGQGALGLGKDLIGTLAPALKVVVGLFDVLIKSARGWLIVLNELGRNPLIEWAQRQADAEMAGKTTPEGLLGGLIGKLQRPAAAPVRQEDINGGAAAGFTRIPRGSSSTPEKGPEDFGASLLENLNKQLGGLSAKSNLARTALELLDKQYIGLSASMRRSILDTAKSIDLAELQKKAMDSLRSTVDKNSGAVDVLLNGEKSHLQIVDDLIAANRRMNIEVDDGVETIARFNAVLLDMGKIAKANAALMDAGVFADVFKGVASGLAGGGANGAVSSQQMIDAMGGALPPAMIEQMGLLDQLSQKISDFFGTGIQGAKAWGDALSGTFSAVSQGFSQVIFGFLMGEKLSGKAFMQMAKSAIAAVAAEAAVRSLFELAMGLASLWLNPPKAASHFLAAKTFGLVAGVAAGVSLAIPGGGNSALAGNAIQGGSSNSRNGIANNEPVLINANRRGGDQTITHILEVRSNDSHIINVVARDIQSDGKLRLVLGNDGMLATP